ncbi:YhjR family protein [Pantoea sp. B65]
MTKNKNILTTVNVSGQSDDINALGKTFSFNANYYVDIARDERLDNILARWPLLDELAAERQEKGN